MSSHYRALLLPGLAFSLALGLAPGAVAQPIPVAGLDAAARIERDVDGIPHLNAATEHDLFFLQGWIHAEDRLFQMDLTRRQPSGTLAELVGSSALGSDVELRTLGLRRAAERSLAVLSERTRDALQAYADGVNAWVASHPLPAEYQLLELTSFAPWTPLDSAVIGKAIAFSLSFDLDIGLTQILLTYQGTGALAGFDGTALFFEDLFRSAPFDPASTVPDAQGVAPPVIGGAMAPRTASGAATPAAATTPTLPLGFTAEAARRGAATLSPRTLELAQEYLDRVRRVPFLANALEHRGLFQGSNEWAVSGRHTASGKPLLANDPHLALNTPATFYQIHLRSPETRMDVIGSGFPGVPFVILGQNLRLAWGATTNPLDVTDTFQEQVVPDPASPSGLSTVYLGNNEPILPLPQVFRFNQPGDGTADNLATAPPNGMVGDTFIPAVVLIVPRRNEGPIVSLDTDTGVALSIQYTGFGATREVEAFRVWNRARNLREFVQGLQLFDVGSQNWAVADVFGNIAYFTSAEMPLREDLQAATVNGLPPYFIRNGTGGNEWLPVTHPQPEQAVPFEILPFSEMPKVINPRQGWFVNANNDAAGTTLDNDPLNQLRPGGGIYYLNPGYASGFRAGRITQALAEKMAAGPVSREDLAAIQANVTLLDAEVLTPYLVEAFQHAATPDAPNELRALAAEPRIAEAIDRLSHWDYTFPTGIPEGFDASDVDGERLPPGDEEIAASVAATIYSVWRGQALARTIDAALAPFGLPTPGSAQAMTALRHLLDSFDAQQGIGASGLDFFPAPDLGSREAARDFVLLSALADALDRLAGPAFAAAFGGSADQDDYRWGRLHRIVFDHPLGSVFNIPPAAGAFPPPLPDLTGIPADGGFGAVDASSHSARAADSEGFRFGSGPVRRFVGEPGEPGHFFTSQTILPGGESGVLGSPFYANLLPRWLTNDTYPVRQSFNDYQPLVVQRWTFVPAP